ncbi:MAG: porphobilinogen synthase [Nitrospirae bacterium]|nr:porphobilinogen synthase [Candidatus Troglogloeales bacterium]MBI3598951.1 porphobilinogen synthase [Candidatus Troglogloeales bacterium]
MFPVHRGRRLRQNESIRRLVRESHLLVDDLILPLFVTHGRGGKSEIASMPGQYRHTIKTLLKETAEAASLGIPAVILFGIPKIKDEGGSTAIDPEGIVQTAISAIKDQSPNLLVITDVCIDEYTSHGHCGLVQDGKILNDETLAVLAKMALSHVEAGADMVAPSDMMDGRVGAIRKVLDENGHTQTPILSYAVKYASCFYTPFREAAGSAPSLGDRKSYQMDFANSREAIREVAQDIEEGADIVMVKPALPYLDILADIKKRFDVPIAAYQVSGEYSMIMAAAQNGWLDGRNAMLESLIALKRAGADMILTYFAKEAAKQLS